MKKTIISEQSTQKLTQQRVIDTKGVTHDAVLELAKQHCDGLKNFKFQRAHPTKGVDALSYQRTDGGWNFIINDNNVVKKERYDTEGKLLSSETWTVCQNEISPQIPLPWTEEQERFLRNYKTQNDDIILEKPVKELELEYTPIDMWEFDKTLFPKGTVFLYKHSKLIGVNADQIEALKRIFTGMTKTMVEPGLDDLRYKQWEWATDVLTQRINPEGAKILKQVNDARAASSSPNPKDKEPLRVWPLEVKSPVDLIKSVKTASKAIKDDRLSRETCRSVIKFLYKNATKGGKNTAVSDVDLGGMIEGAKKCMTQGTKYLNGIVGIQNEINYLQKCNSTWCTGPLNVKPDGTKCPVGQYYDIDRGRCMGTRTNESTRKLQNLIRESLLETKKTKEKNVLSEGKIVKARLSIISENVNFKTKKQKDKFFDELLSEMVYLNSQGFDKQVINEGFFDMLKSLLGHTPDGVMEYFKEYMGKWLVEHLTPMDSEGWFGSMIITGIGNLPIGDIPKLTDCNYLTKWISKTAAEGTVRKLTHEKGLDGAFYDILRNSIVDMLDATSLGSKIEEALGGVICPLLGGVKNKMEKATDTLKQKALATS